jgi:prolipoprotein diacylglyceryltransferase
MTRIPDLTTTLGPVSISPHFFFEALAYAVGFALYQRARDRSGDVISGPDRNSIIVAAILGAAAGSKVLAWFENFSELARHWQDPIFWLGGKTIIGGILGGTIAVEWVKRRLKITTRTGDLFAIPMCLGMAVGRVGCFFGGLADHTYGIPTSLPWAIDFGDGIGRHPTQLYEALFLLILAGLLRIAAKLPHQSGDLYRLFLFFYLVFRLCVEFIKPDPPIAGLTPLQWISLLGALWYLRDVVRIVLQWRTAKSQSAVSAQPIGGAN